VNTGDHHGNPESLFFISLGFKRLLIGQRTHWTEYSIALDLRAPRG
jgi:hypothetical protein